MRIGTRKQSLLSPFSQIRWFLCYFFAPSYAPYPPSHVCFSHSAKRKRKPLLRTRVGGSPISYSGSEISLILRLGYWILQKLGREMRNCNIASPLWTGYENERFQFITRDSGNVVIFLFMYACVKRWQVN